MIEQPGAPPVHRGSAVPVYYESSPELSARLATNLGIGWPRPDHRLLLAVAGAPDDRAQEAWHAWRRRPNAGDPNRLDAASARLFAQAAPNLRRLGLDDPMIQRGMALYRHTWSTNQLRLRGALHAVEILDAVGVESMALKGLALLAESYSDVGLRPMFDIDLLVHPEQLGLALRRLVETGWQPIHDHISPATFSGEVPPGYSRQLARGRVELDLHWHALGQDESSALNAAIWKHATMRTLLGAPLRCPDATEALLVVCLHGMVWNVVVPTLWPLDACRLLLTPGGIDWRRLLSLAISRRLVLPLFDALRFLVEVLEAPVPKDALEELGEAKVLELECLEYTALARGPRGSHTPERWARHQLATRRREERLVRRVEPANPAAPATPDAPLGREGRGDSIVSATPLVSCLCVTENRHAFIPWLLWCYERQDWPHRELVVIDSSDPPIALADLPGVRVLRMPPGTPLGAKRNFALDNAHGELVAWFDDDDWQHPSRLRLLIERLSLPTTRHDTTHVGPCNGWFADIFSEAATEHRAPGFSLFNGSLFVRKNIAGRRFVDGLRSSEDTVWLRSLSQTPRSIGVGLELPPLFFWLCHDANTSNPRTARSFERRLDELRELVGPAWGDTSGQLDALRLRLGATAPHAMVSAPPAITQSTRTLGRTKVGTPRLWIVTPCMGRLSFLRQTAPRALSHPSVNYCLVDYSCPERCGDWLEARFPEAVRSGRCVVERVVGKTVFNKCAAHNAGARRAIDEGADYLCFLDADSVVETGFFPWLLERLAPSSFLIAARRSDGFDMPSLTGLLVVSAAEFGRTDGFDESFEGWGSEDIEMRLRLHVLNGLGFADVPLSLVRPLDHEDALRSSHYEEKDIHRSDARNYALMLHKLHSWSREHPFDRKIGGRLFYRPPPTTSTRSSESPPVHQQVPPRPAVEPLAPFVVRDSKYTVAFDDSSPLPSGRPCRVRLYAACFEPEDEQRVDPPLRAQIVSSRAPYFEHDALIAVFANRRSEWANADFVGVLVPHGGDASEPAWAVLGRQLIATGCGYDAYGLRADGVHTTAWRSLGRMETRALDIARHLLVRRLGVPESLVFRRVPLIRANRWIARKAVFERFVKEWLMPARAALEDPKDRELQALLRLPPSGSRQPIPPEPWLRRGPDGSICASYHPYVLERLAPLFFVHGGYRVRSF